MSQRGVLLVYQMGITARIFEVHAIHETNIGYEPIVSDRLKPYLNRGVIENPPITNIDAFIESGKKYFKDFLEYIDIDESNIDILLEQEDEGDCCDDNFKFSYE